MGPGSGGCCSSLQVEREVSRTRLPSKNSGFDFWERKSSSDDCAPEMMIKKQASSAAVLAFGVVGVAFLAYWAKISPVAPGLITVFLAFVGWVFVLVLARRCYYRLVGPGKASNSGGWVDQVLVSLGALAVGVVVVEGWLHLADVLDLGRSAGQGIPVEWQKRDTIVPGARSAHYWHGILFIFDENGMRRTEPFPPRTEDRRRIMVVGDSLTYGYGVSIEETYPSLLSKALSKHGSVEVLNLGVSGLASEEILGVVRRFVPEIQPDIIVYGICVNDFLPLGVKDYSTPQVSWIPVRLKVFLASRTKVGALVRDSYVDLLVALGVRHDFFDDILKDYGSYRTRFARDLKAINDFVVRHGLPPVVSVVLDQNPDFGGRGHRIAQFAEEAARSAGMTVVATEEYYRTHDGERMSVSQWEGHPNSKAHRLFAEILESTLRDQLGLSRCRLLEQPQVF